MVGVQRKDLRREMMKSMPRLLSLIAIVMLGVAFLSGLLACTPDMHDAADEVFREANLMDLQVISTLGLTEADVQAMEALDEVEAVMPSRSVMVYAQMGEITQVAKVASLPAEGTPAMNRFTLVEGRMPEAADECVVLAETEYEPMLSYLNQSFSLYLEEEDLSEDLLHQELKVVGIAQSPMYVYAYADYGTTQLGNGQIDWILYAPMENFVRDVYTELYIRASELPESAFVDAYEDRVEAAKGSVKAISQVQMDARYQEVVGTAQEKLDEARAELEEAQQERDEKIADAQQDIDDAKIKLADGQKELEEQEADFRKQIADGERAIRNAEKKLDAAEKEIEANEKELAAGKKDLAAAKKELEPAEALLKEGQQGLSQLASQIQQLKDQGALLEPESAEYAAVQENLAEMEAVYSAQSAELSQAQTQYDRGARQIRSAEREIREGESAISAAKKEITEGRSQLRYQSRKLEEGRKEGEEEIAKAKQTIADAEIELADGEAELKKQTQESAEKLEDAWVKIDDAQKEIDDIDEAEWYYTTRDDLPGYAAFGGDVQQLQTIAYVVPPIFFLVAALVSLTGMTRMVEEQRMEIGTLKALGYSGWRISQKYIIYALVAGVTGSLIGVLVGMTFFPKLVSGAYQILYSISDARITFWPHIIAVSSGTAIGVLLLATVYICSREIAQKPSELMRPKPPKSGKRVWLERIDWIWRRLGFLQKVTVRNLFRYKLRFLMTIVGIAGCTGLLVTGYGLMDSITGILDMQYPRIDKYHSLIITKADLQEADQQAVLDLARASGATDGLWSSRESVTVEQNGKSETATVIAYREPERVEDFMGFYPYGTQEPVALSHEGAVITAKLSRIMGLKTGDVLTMEDDDHNQYEVRIAGIRENYIGNQIEMTPTLYQQVFGEMPDDNQLLVYLEEGLSAVTFAERMLVDENVLTLRDIRDTSSVKDMLNALNTVVWAIIISAGLLAFVVLFNLTSINIMERERELATIKVLGFYDSEVNAYVLRENAILTVLGGMVGLLVGILLHRFIITLVETGEIMFVRTIKADSFVKSFAMTLFFSAAVNLIMFPRLKKIDMVASLKSVE